MIRSLSKTHLDDRAKALKDSTESNHTNHDPLGFPHFILSEGLLVPKVASCARGNNRRFTGDQAVRADEGVCQKHVAFGGVRQLQLGTEK